MTLSWWHRRLIPRLPAVQASTARTIPLRVRRAVKGTHLSYTLGAPRQLAVPHLENGTA